MTLLKRTADVLRRAQQLLYDGVQIGVRHRIRLLLLVRALHQRDDDVLDRRRQLLLWRRSLHEQVQEVAQHLRNTTLQCADHICYRTPRHKPVSIAAPATPNVGLQ